MWTAEPASRRSSAPMDVLELGERLRIGRALRLLHLLRAEEVALELLDREVEVRVVGPLGALVTSEVAEVLEALALAERRLDGRERRDLQVVAERERGKLQLTFLHPL